MEIAGITIRHFNDIEDHSLPNRDFDIRPEEIVFSEQIAETIQLEADRQQANRLLVFTSPKKRAMQTTVSVLSSLLNKIDINVDVIVDDRLQELNHGIFNLPSDFDKSCVFLPDKLAWDTWVKEVFESRNLLYRYGDPFFLDGNPKYPVLVGHFKEFGESQAKFSQRIYDFLIDLSTRLNDEGIVPIVFSHLANILRIHEISHVLEEFDCFGYISPGTLPYLEWEAMINLPEGLYEKVSMPIYTTTFNLNLIKKHATLLERERDIMRSLIMQDYEP